jgi:rhodanese-related sulfurtransferase
VAQQLRSLGFDAAALEGGFAAWRQQYPVERAEAVA